MTIILETVTPQGRVRTRRNAKPPRPLDHAGQQMAEASVGLGVFLARRKRRHLPLDEAVGVALFGLVEAVGRFEGDRGVRFGGYAGRVIEHRLAAAEQSEAHRAARFAQHAEDQHEAQLPDDHQAEPGQAVGTAEAVARLRRLLTPAEFDLLWQAFALDRPLAEIGRDRGLSRQRMSQLAVAAVRKARRILPRLSK